MTRPAFITFVYGNGNGNSHAHASPIAHLDHLLARYGEAPKWRESTDAEVKAYLDERRRMEVEVTS